jgi:hypothetical protein
MHFAFTITYHYLFPQLTMGLAPLIVILKLLALRRNDPTFAAANIAVPRIDFCVTSTSTPAAVYATFTSTRDNLSRQRFGAIQPMGKSRQVRAGATE